MSDAKGPGTIRTGTVIIGAGPAGLSVAACLRRINEPYEILERATTVGNAWRHHYDRLHLHTDRDHSVLPHHLWPAGTPRYPSREQVIAYLETYARAEELRPRFGRTVVAAGRNGPRWATRTDGGERYESDRIVVATGVNGEPHVPQWPGRDAFAGPVLHSSEYRNGERFRGLEVLVVGFGNSGAEIAIDLYESGAQPELAVRGPVNVIPREVFGIPILSLSPSRFGLPTRLADALARPLLRLILGDIRRLGLRKLPYGPGEQIRRTGTVPMIDVGTLELLRRGQARVRPGIERFTGDGVVFEDGRPERYDAVILATGYRARLDRFLELPEESGILNGGGTTQPELSGRRTPVPGLYFCGFYVSPGGMLREIGIEARRIARDVAARRTGPVA